MLFRSPAVHSIATDDTPAVHSIATDDTPAVHSIATDETSVIDPNENESDSNAAISGSRRVSASGSTVEGACSSPAVMPDETASEQYSVCVPSVVRDEAKTLSKRALKKRRRALVSNEEEEEEEEVNAVMDDIVNENENFIENEIGNTSGKRTKNQKKKGGSNNIADQFDRNLLSDLEFFGKYALGSEHIILAERSSQTVSIPTERSLRILSGISSSVHIVGGPGPLDSRYEGEESDLKLGRYWSRFTSTPPLSISAADSVPVASAVSSAVESIVKSLNASLSLSSSSLPSSSSYSSSSSLLSSSSSSSSSSFPSSLNSIFSSSNITNTFNSAATSFSTSIPTSSTLPGYYSTTIIQSESESESQLQLQLQVGRNEVNCKNFDMIGRTNNFDYSYGHENQFLDSFQEGSKLTFFQEWDSIECDRTFFKPFWSDDELLEFENVPQVVLEECSQEEENNTEQSKKKKKAKGRKGPKNILQNIADNTLENVPTIISNNDTSDIPGNIPGKKSRKKKNSKHDSNIYGLNNAKKSENERNHENERNYEIENDVRNDGDGEIGIYGEDVGDDKGVKRFTTTRAAAPCRFFSTLRGCKYGDTCPFAHSNGTATPLDGPHSLVSAPPIPNSIPIPISKAVNREEQDRDPFGVGNMGVDKWDGPGRGRGRDGVYRNNEGNGEIKRHDENVGDVGCDGNDTNTNDCLYWTELGGSGDGDDNYQHNYNYNNQHNDQHDGYYNENENENEYSRNRRDVNDFGNNDKYGPKNISHYFPRNVPNKVPKNTDNNIPKSSRKKKKYSDDAFSPYVPRDVPQNVPQSILQNVPENVPQNMDSMSNNDVISEDEIEELGWEIDTTKSTQISTTFEIQTAVTPTPPSCAPCFFSLPNRRPPPLTFPSPLLPPPKFPSTETVTAMFATIISILTAPRSSSSSPPTHPISSSSSLHLPILTEDGEVQGRECVSQVKDSEVEVEGKEDEEEKRVTHGTLRQQPSRTRESRNNGNILSPPSRRETDLGPFKSTPPIPYRTPGLTIPSVKIPSITPCQILDIASSSFSPSPTSSSSSSSASASTHTTHTSAVYVDAEDVHFSSIGATNASKVGVKRKFDVVDGALEDREEEGMEEEGMEEEEEEEVEEGEEEENRMEEEEQCVDDDGDDGEVTSDAENGQGKGDEQEDEERSVDDDDDDMEGMSDAEGEKGREEEEDDEEVNEGEEEGEEVEEDKEDEREDEEGRDEDNEQENEEREGEEDDTLDDGMQDEEGDDEDEEGMEIDDCEGGRGEGEEEGEEDENGDEDDEGGESENENESDSDVLSDTDDRGGEMGGGEEEKEGQNGDGFDESEIHTGMYEEEEEEEEEEQGHNKVIRKIQQGTSQFNY